MANDFAQVAEQAYQTAHEAAATGRFSFEALTTPIVEEIGTVNQGEVFGLTTYSAKTAAGRPTAKDLDSATTSTSMAAYEERLTIMRSDWEHDVRGVQEQVRQLVEMGWLTLSQAFWGGLASLDSTTHPYNSESWLTAQGGGDVYYCDAVSIDPVGSVASFNQQNVYTTALSDSAVSSSLNAHFQYRNWAGNPWVTRGKPYLVYNPALATTAEDMINRQNELSAGNDSGTPVTLTPTGSRLAGGVPIDGLTSYSSVDWYLIWVQEQMQYGDDGSTSMVKSCPIQPWIRTLPEVTIEKIGNDMEVTAYMEYAIHYGARSFDVIMHNV